MITFQIKGISVAVRLFLLKFSNTEGHPYAAVDLVGVCELVGALRWFLLCCHSLENGR